MKATLIQFFSGPSSGKSTLAYKLAGELKSLGINCELVTEVAKDVTWEENFNQLKNQFFITAKHFDRVRRLEDKVDYIIMDAGFLQNIPYLKDERYKKELISIMKNLHNSYNTINFFVHRLEIYDTNGRKENIEESKYIDNETFTVLKKEGVIFTEITSNIKINALIEILGIA